MSLQISLSSDGTALLVQTPSDTLVQVPANAKGMALLVDMLTAQLSARSLSLGGKAVPTQDMVRDFLRSGGTVKKAPTPITRSAPRGLVKIADGVYKRAPLPKRDDQITVDDLMGDLD